MAVDPHDGVDAGTARDYALVVDSARSAVAQEFQISERLDAKARNQMTVAGTWYAIVTAIAGVALQAQLENGAGTWLFALVVVLAAVAGACLMVALYYSYGVWKLRTESEIDPEGLELMAADAIDPSVDVGERLVRHYAYLLKRRRANNAIRAERFEQSVKWWVASLGVSLCELVAALAALVRA